MMTMNEAADLILTQVTESLQKTLDGVELVSLTRSEDSIELLFKQANTTDDPDLRAAYMKRAEKAVKKGLKKLGAK